MINKIKKIREKTGAGIALIKSALLEAAGDEVMAVEILRKKGVNKAFKKAGRAAKEGNIFSYIHTNKRVGAMVKLYCESDFVERNEEFQELGKDIAMHITALNPKYIKPEDVPETEIEKEKKIWKAQLRKENKPAEIMEKILSGKEEKFRRDISLLTQPFVKNPDVTVGELISEKISKMGENIQVGEFVRYEI